MARQGTRRMKSLRRQAEQAGYQTVVTQDQIASNPKNGNIIHTRGRNTLYVLSQTGELILTHVSGLPRTNNSRIEKKLHDLLSPQVETSVSSPESNGGDVT